MKGIFKRLIPVVSVLAVLLFSASAQAAARCKELSHSQCAANDSCSWVKAYTTKSGTQVNAYCHVKSGKKDPAGKGSDKANKADKTKKVEQSKKNKKAKLKGEDSSKQKSKQTDKTNKSDQGTSRKAEKSKQP